MEPDKVFFPGWAKLPAASSHFSTNTKSLNVGQA
jgi:hypothetical protein